VFNPEPLAPFLDFFVIGDGEDAVVDVAQVLLRVKGRAARLEALGLLGFSEEAANAVKFWSPDDHLALAVLEAFEAGPWGQNCPAIAQAWRRHWDQVIPFFVFSPPIRRIM
jgi:radical SAM superfamily enzyme YgiQ (UPF0313 family)